MISDRHQSLANPSKRKIRVNDLCSVECFIGKFNIAVIQIEKSEVGPRLDGLEGISAQTIANKGL